MNNSDDMTNNKDSGDQCPSCRSVNTTIKQKRVIGFNPVMHFFLGIALISGVLFLADGSSMSPNIWTTVQVGCVFIGGWLIWESSLRFALTNIEHEVIR